MHHRKLEPVQASTTRKGRMLWSQTRRIFHTEQRRKNCDDQTHKTDGSYALCLRCWHHIFGRGLGVYSWRGFEWKEVPRAGRRSSQRVNWIKTMITQTMTCLNQISWSTCPMLLQMWWNRGHMHKFLLLSTIRSLLPGSGLKKVCKCRLAPWRNCRLICPKQEEQKGRTAASA